MCDRALNLNHGSTVMHTHTQTHFVVDLCIAVKMHSHMHFIDATRIFFLLFRGAPSFSIYAFIDSLICMDNQRRHEGYRSVRLNVRDIFKTTLYADTLNTKD